MRALSRLRDGLVGSWCPSVSGWGGNVLRDLSGQGNHGTLTNMDPATDWVVSPGSGGAIALGATTSVKRVAIGPRTISTNSTVAMWVFRLANPGLHRCLSLTETAYSIQAGDNPLCNVSGNTVTHQNSIGNLKWHHLVVQWDNNGVVYLYLDAVRSSTSATTVIGVTDQVNLGNQNDGSRPFNGYFDDIRIYNRALSPNEIRLLASERGIGLRPERKRRYVQGQTFTAARLRRQSLIGSGVY